MLIAGKRPGLEINFSGNSVMTRHAIDALQKRNNTVKIQVKSACIQRWTDSTPALGAGRADAIPLPRPFEDVTKPVLKDARMGNGLL